MWELDVIEEGDTLFDEDWDGIFRSTTRHRGAGRGSIPAMPSSSRWAGGPFQGGLQALGFTTYADYLASPHWQGLRKELLSEASCFVCGCEATELHHRRYINLGAEKEGDLVPLCRQHHQDVHRILKVRPRLCRGLSDAHIALKSLIESGTVARPA